MGCASAGCDTWSVVPQVPPARMVTTATGTVKPETEYGDTDDEDEGYRVHDQSPEKRNPRRSSHDPAGAGVAYAGETSV